MAKSKKEKPYLEAEELSLSEWLKIALQDERDQEYMVADYQFPTDSHQSEYMASIAQRSDQDVKSLIRKFLLPPGILGHDKRTLDFWIKTGGITKALEETEYARRLLKGKAWEGTTWVLDLLPDDPKLAINVIDAFIRAHAQFLPDGRIFGLCDAISIIEHKYLFDIKPREILDLVSPRDFEYLVAALFRQKGYSVRVTKQTRDGGADIVCTSKQGPVRTTTLIECKHYTGSIGVEVVRQLAGVVGEMGASGGYVVTSGKFTAPALNFANKTGRIQLIDFKALTQELNTHIGSRWGERLPHIVSREQHDQTRESGQLTH